MQNSTAENSTNTSIPNNEQVGSTNPVNPSPEQKTPASMGQVAQDKMKDMGQTGVDQVGKLGQAGIDQVGKLGEAGVKGIGRLGQAGVNQLGGLVSQFTSPLTNKVVQPPVKQDEKIYGGIAYIPFVALVSIILKPDSAFVRLHAKQGILLTILFFFVGLLAAIVSIFGTIGTFLSLLLGLVPLGAIVIGIYSMYLAFTGYWWKIPGLGAVADLIPIESIAKVSKENLTGQVGIAKEDYENRKETLSSEKKENTPPVPVNPVATDMSTAPAAQPTANAPADQNNNNLPNQSVSQK